MIDIVFHLYLKLMLLTCSYVGIIIYVPYIYAYMHKFSKDINFTDVSEDKYIEVYFKVVLR